MTQLLMMQWMEDLWRGMEVILASMKEVLLRFACWAFFVFVGEVDHVLIRVNKCFFGFGFGALGGERCSPWAYQHQSPCSSLPHS